MLERVLLALAIAIIGWLEKRAERGSTAVDAARDDGRLARAGERIRRWMRKPNDSRPGE